MGNNKAPDIILIHSIAPNQAIEGTNNNAEKLAQKNLFLCDRKALDLTL